MRTLNCNNNNFCQQEFLKLFATFQDLQSNGGYPSKPICARSQPGECAKLEDGDEPRLALLWHHPLYCSRRKGASTSVLFGAGDFVATELLFFFGALLTMMVLVMTLVLVYCSLRKCGEFDTLQC